MIRYSASYSYQIIRRSRRSTHRKL
uniref:Uncharacterized protein n=1 Tax=Arundo donax TaxID=35708 RepID=A0A0A8Z581_ARUDO